MKKGHLRAIVAMLFVLAVASTTMLADGVPAPICYPKPCQSQ